MGLLHGAVACTRFNAAVPPDGPDFDAAPFREIELASEVRERIGFVPFEPGAPYEVGSRRWAFRVRIDRRVPDATAVRERVRELVHTELETTNQPFVGTKRRKELRALAEAELLLHQAPRTRILECAFDGNLLYVGSTAKTHLGIVLALVRQAGVAAEWKAPWLDEAPEADEASDIVIPKEPGQSVLGCRFLKALLEDPDVLIEPETGSVRLATREARVTLAGGVLNELHRLVAEGAEMLAAKLLMGTIQMRFDALSYRLASLKLEPVKGEHWTVELDARLAQIADVWDTLDGKYRALAGQLGPAPAGEAAAPVEA
ncbi:MAG TPA: hypothetical protein VN783_06365 [Thermoanaerobaculia bacterium]|nr:hypothetical protein [Thermoanaerobaculia bacterium]